MRHFWLNGSKRITYWNQTNNNPHLTIQLILECFKKYLPLNGEEAKLLAERVTQRQIKRRQMILQEGFVCKHYTFVEKGCFKMYGVDEKGNEHNISFAAENDWIADLGSFYSEKPSKLFIEAIEPSVILQIEKQDLLFLFVNVPKFDRNFRVIIEEKFIELQNRLLQNFSSNANKRYADFLVQYPQLALRLPNTQIASYLGITPEFLSKIRGEKSLK
jgi:CRP-like cAMP-binding protein